MKLSSFLACCFSPKALSCTELNQSQREAQFQTQAQSIPTSEARTYATGREQRTSLMEIQLRNSLNKAKQENAHGIPTLAAMLSWGQKTFDKLCEQEDFVADMKSVRKKSEKSKQSPATFKKIANQCQDQAYDLYTKEIGREPVLLEESEQEALLRELQEIENDKVKLHAQHPIFNGINPVQALEIKREMALKFNFYIYPRGEIASTKRKIESRISLSVKPNHVVKVAKKLADEFGGEFDNILHRYKVMAPHEHGQRADNIVIYLRQTKPERAKQFAEHLYASMPPDVWEQQSPLGMHAFFPGIAYGESPSGTNSSLGRNRAEVIAKAILEHMTDQVPLDDAIKKALESHKYSLKNPAFVERPRLEKILERLS